MKKVEIFPSTLKGCLKIPPSKSQTLRAILFAALAKGISTITHPLESPDTEAMLQAVQALGAKVVIEKGKLLIEGFNGKPKRADDIIDCGNSGITLRFIGALAMLIKEYTILTGDFSIRHLRSSKPLLEALSHLGVFADSMRKDSYAPLLIRGPLTHFQTQLEGQDSQPVSALLIAASFAKKPIEIFVKNPGETPWIDVTLDWLRRFHIEFTQEGYHFYRLKGNAQIEAFSYSVPADWSSAAFPLIGALMTNSRLQLYPLDLDDVQGDKIFLSYLQKMGASIDIQKQKITIEKRGPLQGICIDGNTCIDGIVALATLSCFAESPTEIFNIEIARQKESNRLSAITKELTKMGAHIEEKPSSLKIFPSQLTGARLFSHQDHRIAMSLSMAALAATGKSEICDVACIEKSYPHFYRQFAKLGAKIQ